MEAPPAALSALLTNVVSAPDPVRGADGLNHLAYEMRITNQSPLTITIEQVETLDAATGSVIGRLAGEHLSALYRPALGTGGTAIPRGQSGTLFFDAALPPEAPLPAAIRHRFTLATDGAEGAPSELVFTTGATPVGQEQAVTLDPPLRGKGWIVAGGCCATISSHRGATLAINGTTYVAERFAIDFVQLGAHGRIRNGPIDKIASYPYFGTPVHAVAEGVVAAVRDGLPEQTPGKDPSGVTLETAGGNHVVLDIGHGRFAFFAHLQPGSLRVKTGDRVNSGDILGLLGNSGNSDAPHLHFHVMDGASPLASNGLPYVFRSFEGRGAIDDEDALFLSGGATIDAAALAGPHENELPLNLEIIDFPD
jgi:murein DD-endopeptidase MepM/ murein hydrolase activator NlpD